MDVIEAIIKELQELQEKAISNSDIWTIQMCIEIVKKHKKEEFDGRIRREKVTKD